MFLSLVLMACGMPSVVEEEQPVDVVEPEPEPDALDLPDEAPGSGEDIASGGLREPDPNATGRAPPDDFNPVSIPLGPREGGGVKWKGVKKKSSAGVDADTLEAKGMTEAELEQSIGFEDPSGGEW